MSSIAWTSVIVVAIIVLFVTNRVPVVLVAIGTALSLYFTGVTDFHESVSGLGDPAVIFIAALFVVSAGLDATGVTAWAGQLLTRHAGQSAHRMLLLTLVLSAGLAALIGALVMASLDNGMSMLDVDAYWQMIVKGSTSV